MNYLQVNQIFKKIREPTFANGGGGHFGNLFGEKIQVGPTATHYNLLPIDQGGVTTIQNCGGGHSDHIFGDKLQDLSITLVMPTQLHQK